MLYDVCSQAVEVITILESYQLLVRMLKEQTDLDVNNKLTAKSGKKISSTSLQNPTDPEATYRKKYGDNIGYIANVVEAFNDDNSVITNYDLKQNIYSDSSFSDDVIENIATKKSAKDKVQVITDGAYYEQEKAKEASKQGIDLIPGELVGRKPSTDKLPYSDFVVDNDKNIITQCSNGNEPVKSYNKLKAYTAKFDKTDCESCPLRDK